MNTGKLDFSKYNNKSLGMVQEVELMNDQYEMTDNSENIKLLEKCEFYWNSLRDFRNRRKRNRKYYRGDQWGDIVFDPDSDEYVTEETYIKNQGKVPLKQNVIRQMVKNLIGQMRSNPTKTMVIARAKEDGSTSEMLSNALDSAHGVNKTTELDARAFEEFLLSGAPIQKLSYRFWHERNIEDLYVQNVNPQRAFFNSDVSDVRLHDLRLIGEIIDTTLDDVIVNFAGNSSKKAKWIKEIYQGGLADTSITQEGLTADKLDYLSFYIPTEKDKCRLFEVWEQRSAIRTFAHDPTEGTVKVVKTTLKEIAEINQGRINQAIEEGIPLVDENGNSTIPLIDAYEKPEKFWYVKFLTPTGDSLWEGETPYAHESHPYALALYPLLDGEVWGLVEDVIDQQRYINRLVIMMDFIISASAKGVLLVPEGAIPEDMDISDFSDEWSKFNGVIKYKPSKNFKDIPQQIAANSTNIGIQEMLALQMNYFQEIGGVHSAIQGKEAKSGTPSSLYAQQAQNATINSVDYMEVFNSFKESRDMKALKIITQYYKTERYLAIAGNIYAEEAAMYDPSRVQGLDFDVRVTQGMDTPVYRSIIDDTLMKLMEGGAIGIELFLEHTSMPFADKLLQSIRKNQAQMQQGMPPEGLPPELAEQSAQADPRALQMMQQAMGRTG